METDLRVTSQASRRFSCFLQKRSANAGSANVLLFHNSWSQSETPSSRRCASGAARQSGAAWLITRPLRTSCRKILVLGLFVIGVLQHFHQPHYHGIVPPLQCFYCLLCQIVAQHIFWIGTAHPMVTQIRRLPFLAHPRDIASQPAGQSCEVRMRKGCVLVVKCRAE